MSAKLDLDKVLHQALHSLADNVNFTIKLHVSFLTAWATKATHYT